jgi:hypothetical protein
MTPEMYATIAGYSKYKGLGALLKFVKLLKRQLQPHCLAN